MMLTILLSPLGKAVSAFLVAAALMGGIYLYAFQRGADAVLDRLRDDRITILKDGREIDDEVLRADDDALCDLLGGCGLPDEAGTN